MLIQKRKQDTANAETLPAEASLAGANAGQKMSQDSKLRQIQEESKGHELSQKGCSNSKRLSNCGDNDYLAQSLFSYEQDNRQPQHLDSSIKKKHEVVRYPSVERIDGRSLRHFCRERPAPYSQQVSPDFYLPEMISGSKGSHVYNAHTYHTKVPPEVIVEFILKFSKPGDLVLDPFSGSGMTGVAALRQGRRAFLIDLSPFAAFLSYNHCTPVDPLEFEQACRRVIEAVKRETGWLYETQCRTCGQSANTEKTILAELVKCPFCNGQVNLWDVVRDEDERVQKHFICSLCNKPLQRGLAPRVGWIQVQLDLSCSACGRQTARPSDFDRDTVSKIESLGIPRRLWFPKSKIIWGDMWRRGYHVGIKHVADFYTKRNLWTLARLREEICREPETAIRDKLLFVFTNLVWHGSKMRRFNAHGGARPMNAALFIPALIEEANLLTLFVHKARMIGRMLWEIRGFKPEMLRASTQSATNLSNIPKESVDYIFTDPPYGGNILYSEVNMLWEAWLGCKTDPAEEVIISRSQGKTDRDYEKLLTAAFREAYRVLRRGRWLTVTFNTSKKEVWLALQSSLWKAGFEPKFLQILNKGHRSFKQMVSEKIAAHDVIITCQKPSRPGKLRPLVDPDAPTINKTVGQCVVANGSTDPQEIYARVISCLMREGYNALLPFSEFLQILRSLPKPINLAPRHRASGEKQLAFFEREPTDE